MSRTYEKLVQEWSAGDDGWLHSDEPVTLHKDHQRIDYKSSLDRFPRGDRGFWCDWCGLKCTVGLKGDEYGHRRTCKHR